jgi:hypothetical protein
MTNEKDKNNDLIKPEVKPLTQMTEREAMDRIQAIARRMSEERKEKESSTSSGKKAGKLRQKIMIDPKQFPKLK